MRKKKKGRSHQRLKTLNCTVTYSKHSYDMLQDEAETEIGRALVTANLRTGSGEGRILRRMISYGCNYLE